jgi:quinol monooxygenase YgiN
LLETYASAEAVQAHLAGPVVQEHRKSAASPRAGIIDIR